MGKVVFGLLAIAIGLALQGCSADTTIYAVSVAAPQLKIDQIPLNLKGASSVEIDFKSQVTSSQKQITAIQFLYSADGTHFMPVETLSADATSYQWSVPHIDSSSAKVKIIATDSRGLTTEKISNAFNILSTPPQITIQSSNAVVSAENLVTFHGSCKPGNVILYGSGLTPQTSAAMRAHYAAISAPVCSAQGTWSFAPVEVTLNDTFSYTLQQVDAVGNFTQVAFTWARNCPSGQYANGETCVAQSCAANAFSTDQAGCSSSGTRSRTCNANGSAWSAYGSCSCNVGYSGASCNTCAAGFFFNGSSCVVTSCSPGTVVSDSNACSVHGTRSETCLGNGSGFGPWSACACAAGFTGTTCGSCAAGFYSSGNSCLPTQCTANAVNSDTNGCSNQGIHSRTCAVDGSGWGDFSTCACNAGYMGSNCSSCAAGFYLDGNGNCSAQACAPSAANSDTTACSNHGLRSQSCAANGSAWSAWSSCSCNVGYLSADCSQCDTANGFTMINGSCQHPVTVTVAVTVNYQMTEADAAYHTDGANYTDANLTLSATQTSTSKSANSNTGGALAWTWSIANASDTVTVNCYGRPPMAPASNVPWVDASQWPTSGNPGLNLVVKDKNGTTLMNLVTHNAVGAVSIDANGTLPTFLVQSSGSPYTVDCHSFRAAPGTYEIGVHYQPPMWPAQISGIQSTYNGTVFKDPPYQHDEGWSGVEWYNFWQTGNNSYGFMDWLYTFANTQYAFGGTCMDATCATQTGGWSGNGVRVNRLYPERQPLLDGPGQPGQWFEFFDPVAEHKQVDVMKKSGIDFSAFLSEWGATQFCPPRPTTLVNGSVITPTQDEDISHGCIGYNQAMDYFLWENYNRDPSQQVLSAVLTGEIDNFDQWKANADGSYLSTPGGATAADYTQIFQGRIQYYIDHYFNYRDAKGNPLYLFRDGKPVIFMYDTGSMMMHLHSLGISLADLINLSNAVAQRAGYAGIYWVDAASTIITPNFVNSAYTVNDYVTYSNMIRNAGFNAESGWMHHALAGVLSHPDNQSDYNFRGYNEVIQVYSTLWSAILNDIQNHPGSTFKYWVPATAGWDSRPVGGSAGSKHDISRSCDGTGDGGHANDSYHNTEARPWGCSPDGALFSTLLQRAKNVIDQNPATTDQTLIFTTWNDVGEGHYLEPTVGDQGAHTKALHDLFKPNQ